MQTSQARESRAYLGYVQETVDRGDDKKMILGILAEAWLFQRQKKQI